MGSGSAIGRRLGSFVVEDEIARGGMGVVLLARQKSLDRLAVLKRVRADLDEIPELAERFAREARAAGAIHHHNVVAVYDRFHWRGSHYIAQEYVDGLDLASVLLLAGPLPWRIAGLIALEAVRGLEEIHAHGTVHRDLKPANLLIGRRGEVKVADFGLAIEATGSSLTEPGVRLGTPAYMPPEQMLGERVDARCDLFALGALLYEMLTGEPPYQPPGEDDAEGATLLARMQKERYTRVRRKAPGVPRFLAKLIRRCLRAKARHRVASAALVRQRLERGLAALSPSECRAELAHWLWQRPVFERRDEETVVLVAAPAHPSRAPRRWVWGLAGGTAAAAMAAAAAGWIEAHPLPVAEAAAELFAAAPRQLAREIGWGIEPEAARAALEFRDDPQSPAPDAEPAPSR